MSPQTRKFHPELDVCIIQRCVYTSPNGRERIIAGVYSYMGGERKLGICRQVLRLKYKGKALDTPTWFYNPRVGRYTAAEWRAVSSGIASMISDLSAAETLASS